MTVIRVKTGNRRHFLSAAFACAAAGSMSNRGWSRCNDGRADRSGSGSSVSTGRSVIHVYLQGGLSHIDSFDPKPNAPSTIRSAFRSIPTKIPGVGFTEHCPHLAGLADQICILRGVKHGSAIHESAQRLMLTGIQNARAETPTLGAIASWSDRIQRKVPANIAIPSLAQDSGELGQRNASFAARGDGSRLVLESPDVNDESQRSRMERRSRWTAQLMDRGRLETTEREQDDARQAAVQTILSPTLKSTLQLENESAEVQELYGKTTFGEYCLLATRFVEQGARFVTVTLGGWDTHFDGFSTLENQLPTLDRALSGLVLDIKRRDLWSSTTLLVTTDFGRTPLFDGEGGRSHWPQSGIALLAGGRFRRGTVFGKTDDRGEEVLDDPVTPSDLSRTILSELGIDNRIPVPPTGRVLLPEGRILSELLEGEATS